MHLDTTSEIYTTFFTTQYSFFFSYFVTIGNETEAVHASATITNRLTTVAEGQQPSVLVVTTATTVLIFQRIKVHKLSIKGSCQNYCSNETVERLSSLDSVLRVKNKYGSSYIQFSITIYSTFTIYSSRKFRHTLLYQIIFCICSNVISVPNFGIFHSYIITWLEY